MARPRRHCRGGSQRRRPPPHSPHRANKRLLCGLQHRLGSGGGETWRSTAQARLWHRCSSSAASISSSRCWRSSWPSCCSSRHRADGPCSTSATCSSWSRRWPRSGARSCCLSSRSCSRCRPCFFSAVDEGESRFLLHSWTFGAALYAVTIAYLLRYVFQRDVMTADKLYGDAAAYLMLGALWLSLCDRQPPAVGVVRFRRQRCSAAARRPALLQFHHPDQHRLR